MFNGFPLINACNNYRLYGCDLLVVVAHRALIILILLISCNNSTGNLFLIVNNLVLGVNLIRALVSNWTRVCIVCLLSYQISSVHSV